MPVSRVATQKCWYQRLWFYAHSDCECTAELLEAGNVRFGVEIAKDPEQLRKSCATWKRLIDKLDGATRRHLQVRIVVIIVCLLSLTCVCCAQETYMPHIINTDSDNFEDFVEVDRWVDLDETSRQAHSTDCQVNLCSL